jgi:hypothetical protein
MVAPLTLLRKAEGRKAKAALCYRDGLNNAAKQHTHYIRPEPLMSPGPV